MKLKNCCCHPGQTNTPSIAFRDKSSSSTHTLMKVPLKGREEKKHRGRAHWHAHVCRGHWTLCLRFLQNNTSAGCTGFQIFIYYLHVYSYIQDCDLPVYLYSLLHYFFKCSGLNSTNSSILHHLFRNITYPFNSAFIPLSPWLSNLMMHLHGFWQMVGSKLDIILVDDRKMVELCEAGKEYGSKRQTLNILTFYFVTELTTGCDVAPSHKEKTWLIWITRS